MIMKKRKTITLFILMILFMSSCVVFSFYPIYTQEDLFPNDYLLGEFLTEDSASWNFNFYYKDKDDIRITDSLKYKLKIQENDSRKIDSEFDIHIIRIDDQLIADFYLTDYWHSGENEVAMFDLHMLPVHTFAKITLFSDSIHLEWFDPDWLKEQIESGKVRIHHENNDETILLTARPKELKKFVKKNLHSNDAFKDGFKLMLYKQTKETGN